MAARRQYGTTWWGAAWLAALERVDDANRIPRGKTYANSGRVISFGLVRGGGAVEAIVEGSSFAPYEIRVGMKPICRREADELVSAIAADPELVAQLLDGELPQEIADAADRLGIELFPLSWRSMQLSCSCPDSARVCKHIAAVFYVMAAQIDRDPFFIFSFRGIDLKAELADRGISVENAVKIRPLGPEELLERAAEELEDAAAPTPAGDDAGDAPPPSPEEHALRLLRSLPYATLTDLGDAIAPLIPERIPVAQCPDCRELVRQLLSQAARDAKRRLAEARALEGGLPPAAALEALLSELGLRRAGLEEPHFEIDLVSGGADPRPVIAGRLPEAQGGGRREVPVDADRFFREILRLTPAQARGLPPEIECMREIAVAAAELIAHWAIIPAAVVSGRICGACPRIWWLPALRDPAVRALVSRLACGVTPWAERFFSPAACEAGEGVPERLAILGLVAAISGFIAGAATDWRRFMPRDAFELGVACLSLESLDGVVPPGNAVALARALQPFSLGAAYPWRPVLTVRTVKGGAIRINFGILGREADVQAATDAALADEASESSESSEPSGLPDMPPAPEDEPRSRTSGEPPLPTRRPVLLSELLRRDRWKSHRFAALSVLRTLCLACPMLEPIRLTHGKPVALATSDLRDFLFESAPHLTMLGVTLMLPQSLRRLLRPQLTASAGAGKGFSKSPLTKDAIGAFDWKVAIGGRELSEEEFLALAAHAGEVVRSGEDYVWLDPAEIDRIRRTLENPPELTPLERMRAILTGEIEGDPVEVSPEVKDALRRITDVTEVPPPQGLAATLRPYQERGFSWLMKNLSLGMGALIADDMGLGKTLQVIAAILELKNRGELGKRKVLAVVPTTLIANWTREIAKFAPMLSTGVHHGAARELPDAKALPDVTLTSYGTLRRDFEKLSGVRWRLLVLDEAQAIKNVSSAQTAAVRGLRADSVIAMTGTPVENRLMEYWSVLSAVQPRILGTQKDFSATFARPIEAEHDERAAEAFRRLTAPFMLRRLKTDRSIISDLPEKSTIDQFAVMRPEQAALYATTLGKMMEKVREAESREDAETPEGRMARRGLVLRMITSLKQICNSPSQYLRTAAGDAPDSGKGDALVEILGQCLDAGRKVLVFTQYRETGERLQRWIRSAAGERAEFLHGGVPAAERMRMVDRFQEDRTARILILSLKAGGTGLNLTAASAVIHYDLWWNPAVEAQATDRAFRIGQRRDVLVWRFITAGSFEERINEMLEQKRGLADMTVATGEAWIGELPADELNRIFALEEK